MRRIKAGVVMDKYNVKVCHNPRCPKGGIISSKINPIVCGVCKFTEYCTIQCKVKHWNMTHKLECKEITKINFVESLVLTSRCPRNGKHGLHKHPKLETEKIIKTRKEISYYAAKFTTPETPLSCHCGGKVGKREDISPTVMLEEIKCTNQILIHVYVRCKNFNCNQRKKANPLFDLCSLSPSYNVMVLIPFQKEKPSELEYINIDSKHIKEVPEEFTRTFVNIKLSETCNKCFNKHGIFSIYAVRPKDNNNNDNNNLCYKFNDVKDTWECLIYEQ